MTHTAETLCACRVQRSSAWAVAAILSAGLLFPTRCAAAEQNLLKNPGFEIVPPGMDNPPNWATRADSVGRAVLTDKDVHAGRYGIAIPAHTSVEQKVESVAAGAYLARCWIKSESEQPVTFLLQDSDRPWAAYTCSEIKVPRDQWVQIEAFCAMDRSSSSGSDDHRK